MIIFFIGFIVGVGTAVFVSSVVTSADKTDKE